MADGKNMIVERTLFIIKPDAVKRNLIFPILDMVKSSGLKILVQKKILLPEEKIAKLYEQHAGKDFYPKLVQFAASGAAVCAVIEGENAIKRLRDLMGDTYPSKAAPGTIRGKFKLASDIGPSGAVENLVHGSDSPERAKIEIEIFFGKELAV